MVRLPDRCRPRPLQSRGVAEPRFHAIILPVKLLLVEENAHRLEGHYPTLVIRLANALASAGHDVSVLVCTGLAEADKGVAIAQGVRVWSYPRPLQQLQASVTSLRKWGRRGGHLAAILAQVVSVLAVRHQLRRDSRDILVIELTLTADPVFRTLLAPLKTHWAVYQILPPRSRRSLRHQRLPRGVDQCRRRAGGSVRIVANRAVLDKWRSAMPWFETAVAPIAMIDDLDSQRTTAAVMDVDSSAARPDRSDTTDGDGPLALVFGYVHPFKDLQTVIAAYEGRDAPGRVVLAGLGTGEALSRFKAENPNADLRAVTTVDNYVDEKTKDLLYAEADIAILSFVPAISNDSGTLCDAVTHGLPVCCSGPSAAATDVLEYGLGLVFPSGDRVRLRESVRALVRGDGIATEGQNRYRADRAATNVGNSLLRAVTPIDLLEGAELFERAIHG